MSSSIQLVAGQELVVTPSEAGHRLQLLSPGGLVRLTIDVTEAGPVLRFEGAAVAIQVAGPLAIDAERVAIHSRDGLELSCEGNASIRVAGDLETSARAQTVRAELGNVDVQANDDVRLNGERVFLNC